jgi:alpha-L-rhamnosidase
VDFGLRRAREQRHPSKVARRPEPADHEQYLWDVGFHWGEWLEPNADAMPILTGEVSAGDVATAYLYRSLSTVASVGRLIGEDEQADRYFALAGLVRAAWQTEFVSGEGLVEPATQANLTRALAFGLVDDAQRPRVAADLVRLIRDAGTTVGTGFLATPFLLPVLADCGHLDVAYELLLQTKPPSWLHMVEAGATTVWENWEGLDRNGKGSLNHYSKGAVVSFLHEYVAGLRPVPGAAGYSRFEVAPRPGGGIASAEAILHSPYGPIRSSWQLDRDELTVDVTVAPGTSADAILPSGRRATLGPGAHRLVDRAER